MLSNTSTVHGNPLLMITVSALLQGQANATDTIVPKHSGPLEGGRVAERAVPPHAASQPTSLAPTTRLLQSEACSSDDATPRAEGLRIRIPNDNDRARAQNDEAIDEGLHVHTPERISEDFEDLVVLVDTKTALTPAPRMPVAALQTAAQSTSDSVVAEHFLKEVALTTAATTTTTAATTTTTAATTTTTAAAAVAAAASAAAAAAASAAAAAAAATAAEGSTLLAPGAHIIAAADDLLADDKTSTLPGAAEEVATTAAGECIFPLLDEVPELASYRYYLIDVDAVKRCCTYNHPPSVPMFQQESHSR